MDIIDILKLLIMKHLQSKNCHHEIIFFRILVIATLAPRGSLTFSELLRHHELLPQYFGLVFVMGQKLIILLIRRRRRPQCTSGRKSDRIKVFLIYFILTHFDIESDSISWSDEGRLGFRVCFFEGFGLLWGLTCVVIGFTQRQPKLLFPFFIIILHNLNIRKWSIGRISILAFVDLTNLEWAFERPILLPSRHHRINQIVSNFLYARLSEVGLEASEFVGRRSSFHCLINLHPLLLPLKSLRWKHILILLHQTTWLLETLKIIERIVSGVVIVGII